MGMYTHLRLDVEIYPKFKDEVLAYIESVPRLRCTSYYFMDQGKHFIEEDEHAKNVMEPGSKETGPMCVIHADVSLKNYTGEIDAYLEFLKGKICNGGYDGEYVGTVRYEEDLIPDLLFFKWENERVGTIVRRKVEVNGTV
jgi:hypothetical protein